MTAPALVLPSLVKPPEFSRHAGTMFLRTPPHSRDQIARWQAELEQRVPRTKQLSWLYLRWEAGDEWQPVQRYVLWEMIPNEVEYEPGKWRSPVPDEVRKDLEGPSPRSTGYYDTRKGRWMGGACKTGSVDHATWEVYHETRRLFGEAQWGMRYWAIQGVNGGHPLHEPFAVQSVRRLVQPNAPETELPPPGDLPFAVPDNRVWDKIVGYDKYREWRMAADFAFRNHKDMAREDVERAEKAAASMLVWWDAQVGSVLQEYSTHLAEIGWAAKGASAGKEKVQLPDQDEDTTRRMQDVFTPH